jgi:hypothetical protein
MYNKIRFVDIQRTNSTACRIRVGKSLIVLNHSWSIASTYFRSNICIYHRHRQSTGGSFSYTETHHLRGKFNLRKKNFTNLIPTTQDAPQEPPHTFRTIPSCHRRHRHHPLQSSRHHHHHHHLRSHLVEILIPNTSTTSSKLNLQSQPPSIKNPRSLLSKTTTLSANQNLQTFTTSRPELPS